MQAGYIYADEIKIGSVVAYQVSENMMRFGTVIALDPRGKDARPCTIRYYKVRVDWTHYSHGEQSYKYDRKKVSWVRVNNLSIVSF